MGKNAMKPGGPDPTPVVSLPIDKLYLQTVGRFMRKPIPKKPIAEIIWTLNPIKKQGEKTHEHSENH